MSTGGELYDGVVDVFARTGFLGVGLSSADSG